MLDAILNLDKDVFLTLNGNLGPTADTLFFWASTKLIWAPFYTFLLWTIYLRFGVRTMIATIVFVALAVVAADQICNLFKDGLKKFRPTHTPGIKSYVHTVNGYVGGRYGAFSAHAATCFAVMYFMARILKKRVYTFVLIGWATLVAYSRIYLGVHYPLDILCGMVTGIGIGWAAYRLFRLRMLSRYYPYPAA